MVRHGFRNHAQYVLFLIRHSLKVRWGDFWHELTGGFVFGQDVSLYNPALQSEAGLIWPTPRFRSEWFLVVFAVSTSGN